MKFLVTIGETHIDCRTVEVEDKNSWGALSKAHDQCRGKEFVQQIFDEQNRHYYDYSDDTIGVHEEA